MFQVFEQIRVRTVLSIGFHLALYISSGCAQYMGLEYGFGLPTYGTESIVKPC
jgi:hypothetical protein